MAETFLKLCSSCICWLEQAGGVQPSCRMLAICHVSYCELSMKRGVRIKGKIFCEHGECLERKEVAVGDVLVYRGKLYNVVIYRCKGTLPSINQAIVLQAINVGTARCILHLHSCRRTRLFYCIHSYHLILFDTICYTLQKHCAGCRHTVQCADDPPMLHRVPYLHACKHSTAAAYQRVLSL